MNESRWNVWLVRLCLVLTESRINSAKMCDESGAYSAICFELWIVLQIVVALHPGRLRVWFKARG